MVLSQVAALIIFIAMFIIIVMGKIHRFIPALIGAALMILVVFLGIMRSPAAVWSALNLGQLVQARFWIPGHELIESRGVNWQTVIFIGGMMVMVEGMAEAGFFRWLCLLVAKMVRYKTVPILITFMLLSGFLSMFIDSITVMLFLATVTIELARLLKFDPVPVIIAEIFASNVGGSATMSGDPPNIIIGTALGFTFTDFVTNTGPIAWAGMLIALAFFYLAFRKKLGAPSAAATESDPHYPQPREAITSPRLFVVNSLIFVLAIALLVTHAETGISVALIGVIAGMLALGAATDGAFRIAQRVDWHTLLFFIGLFITVSGLEETGVLQIVAEYIGQISGGNLTAVIAIILWFSVFASAVVDNIPFAATMVPVISQLAQTQGLSLPTLSWTLALGADIGGNATPIGASANVVGTAIAEKQGYHIGWGRFMKYAFPATILVVGLVHLLLVMRYT